MTTPRIVVVGSLNMDLVVSMRRMPKLGETLQGNSIHYIPGGKGANQAAGCARLGAEAIMIGAVGEDGFGDQMIRELNSCGVNTSSVCRQAGVPTGTASIFHTPEDNCIVIVPGANGKVAPEMIDRFTALIESADILLLQLEIPLNTVKKALEIAKNAGVRTVLNPAPAQPLPTEILYLVDILTPNESEFELLSGEATASSEQRLMDSMLRWEQTFNNHIVITRGNQGVSYIKDKTLHTVSAPKVEVVDTTGAGDCFNAAFCVGLASGWSLEQAISFGVNAASLSVTKFGAQAGMPTLAEVSVVL